ncbi:hypothetical protein C8R47DRAFT_1138242 [Mycena vitilis]|nr:hypothetical protein C8R47DRAFT_1138242 [Mycena vitilis]
MSSYVVTGAARGLGLEFVSQLSADPSNTVFAIVRNKSTATALNALSRQNITVLEADITDKEAMTAAASAVAAATGGKLDYLINNAGIHDRSQATLHTFPTTDALDQHLLENFRVNTLGTIHTTNSFLPLLRAGTVKKVVTLSSAAADPAFTLATGSAGQTGYFVSKAAQNMAVAKFAMALKPEGFVFMSLNPGHVDTEIQRTPQEDEEYKVYVQRLMGKLPSYSGPVTPEQSVTLMLDVIYRWTLEETGTTKSRGGDQEWL